MMITSLNGKLQSLGQFLHNPLHLLCFGIDEALVNWFDRPPDTLYEGGFFRATLNFPPDFPLRPPKMKFLTEMWHPNSTSITLDVILFFLSLRVG
jgi:ubiquitin-conjugating enzyme E2 G1